MNKIFETVGRISAVAAVSLAAIGLHLADSNAQQIVRARVSPAPVVAEPTAPLAPAPAVGRVAQAPVQTVATPPAAGALRVRRLVVSRSIEDREPAEVATRFTMHTGDRLYAFVELSNAAAPAQIRVHFEPRANPRRAVGLATLPAPTAARWRTWAYSDFVRTPGEWVAVVESADGRELARTPFVVE